ncbi:MAG: hypothetical protein H7174_10600 [Flavobacterium sp.]|nr:hypothetical protein [Flavobacterium sp.]
MKKIIYLFAFSMLLSCSKSEDNPTNNPTNQNNIAGTYKLTEYISGSGIPVDLNKDGVFNSNLEKNPFVILMI